MDDGEDCPIHGQYDGPFCFPCVEAEYGVKISVPHVFSGYLIIRAEGHYLQHVRGCPGCAVGAPEPEMRVSFQGCMN